MRCEYCDYVGHSDESLYKSGTVQVHTPENKVMLREDSRKFLCDDCYPLEREFHEFIHAHGLHRDDLLDKDFDG